MIIGVLCEGGDDEIPAEIFLQRGLLHTSPEHKIKSYHTHSLAGATHVDGFKKAFAILMVHKVDLICIFRDLDGVRGKEKRQFKERVKNNALKALEMFPERPYLVFTFFEREFEEWLLADEPTVKGVLGIPQEEKLWDRSKQPKEALEDLVHSAQRDKRLEISQTTSGIKKDIATNTVIDRLLSDPIFEELLTNLTLLLDKN